MPDMVFFKDIVKIHQYLSQQSMHSVLIVNPLRTNL